MVGAAFLAAGAMAGCGRKNLPVAPQAKATPATSTDAAAAGSTPSSENPATTVNQVAPIQQSTALVPADPSKNKDARRSSFPLDFLLN